VDNSTSDDAADELPPPIIPNNYPIVLRGFESEEAAHKFADILRGLVLALSRYINLERLDGITVAYDYLVALADLDRGKPGLAPLVATSADYGTGVAMTPAVLRDGVVKSHIVFNAAVVREIENDLDKLDSKSLYLVAHECAHVHDCMVRDKAFPNTILQKSFTGWLDSIRNEISSSCWEEYAACRLSAAFASPEVSAAYEELFLGAAMDAKRRANDAIKAYRIHGNVSQVVRAVVPEYGNTLKFAAYLLGTLHGAGKTLKDAPDATKFIAASWCEDSIHSLDIELSTLFETYGDWPDESVFDKIAEIGEQMIADGGMTMNTISDGGMHVDLPFSFETMP
jgi:hypothetical protein